LIQNINTAKLPIKCSWLLGKFVKRKILIPTSPLMMKQKNQSRHARLQALRWVIQRFPNAFNTDTHINALQLGIMQELLKYADEAQAFGISKAKLREALVVFTRRLDYLACLKAQGPRVNLEGEIVGVVSEDEAKNAASKIKKLIEKSQKHQRKNKLKDQDFDFQPMREFYPAHFEAKAQKSVEVVIKSKTSKTLDLNAVNRLRSKLGLSNA
jgi:ProP effector